MRIELTKHAAEQYNFLRKLKTVETGFVFGTDLGKTKIIDKFFVCGFNRRNVNHLYKMALEQYGETLIGVFFLNTGFFLNDWFLQDIIIQIRNHESSIFLYHYDAPVQEKKIDQIRKP